MKYVNCCRYARSPDPHYTLPPPHPDPQYTLHPDPHILHPPTLPSQSLPTEHARQAFIQTASETETDGSIKAEEYVKLMKNIRGFRLSPHVQDHLLAVSTWTQTDMYVHFSLSVCVRWLEDLLEPMSTMLTSRLSISCWVT